MHDCEMPHTEIPFDYGECHFSIGVRGGLCHWLVGVGLIWQNLLHLPSLILCFSATHAPLSACCDDVLAWQRLPAVRLVSIMPNQPNDYGQIISLVVR